MPWKAWTAGDILGVADFQDYVQDQCVLTFADAATRDSTIPVVNRKTGMLAYTQDTDTYWVWTGSAWRELKNAALRSTLTADVTNSTTTLADSGLTIALPASTKWAVEARLWIFSTTADIRVALAVPTGGTVSLSAWPDRPAGGSVTDASRVRGASPAYLDLECQFGGSGTAGMYTLAAYVAIGSTAGDLKLQFAANTTGTVSLEAGSTMFAWRLA